MQEKQALLEVDNLKMYFTSGIGKSKNVVKAVDGVSFNIYESETFGLVGESGCGKTTIGRTLIRIYNPTGGKFKLKGEDISGKMTNSLRGYITRNMAMVFQDPIDTLNPRMTIEEIIAEGLIARGEKNREENQKKIYEMLDKVGLTEEHATRYPHEFSGGQRQRIGIARAIILNPNIVIADEPVSALDVSIQAQIINLLNDLKSDLGLTIMFIAHDLSVVKYFSDRIGVMYYGKLVEIARSDDLYRNPIHPYTRSLLSAIPQPNPLTEKYRTRISYDPKASHDYNSEQPQMREVEAGHFVYCSQAEFEQYQKQ
ncbi:MAG: ATP-binding cassette domain-containing protein [Treponema sp.]|nr:ATP-binding cassette domain-containing protein [Treponema sp.]